MTTDNATLEAQLREMDASIAELASKGEFDRLAGLLAADFHYNHSTGKTETKTEWIEGLSALVGKRDRVPTSIRVELHDDLAVAMGDVDIVWTDGRRAYDRYVRVYRPSNGRWVVVSQRTVPAHDRAPAGH